MDRISIFSPAKINLFLAVNGVREDGFHELTSLVVPLAFGDQMEVSLLKEEGSIEIECNNPEVPLGAGNIIYQAIEEFRKRTGIQRGIKIVLDKRVPMGAGLGGGSANAMSVLKALNELLDTSLSKDEICDISAIVGSDCPLFIDETPKWMEGRGEQLCGLESSSLEDIKKLEIVLWKPEFGVNTGWAYGAMKGNPSIYTPKKAAEAECRSWEKGEVPLEDWVRNDFEKVAFEKFLIYNVLFRSIEESLGLKSCLSGSGSACFTVLKPGADVEKLKKIIQEALGDEVFLMVTKPLISEN